MTDIARLEVSLYARGIRFIHFCPNMSLREQAESNFKAVLSETAKVLDRNTLFMVMRPHGCAMEHYPVVILDKCSRLLPSWLHEARMAAGPDGEHQPMIIEVL